MKKSRNRRRKRRKRRKKERKKLWKNEKGKVLATQVKWGKRSMWRNIWRIRSNAMTKSKTSLTSAQTSSTARNGKLVMKSWLSF